MNWVKELIIKVDDPGERVWDGSPKTFEIQELVRCKDCVHWDIGHTEECDNSDSVCFHNGWCKPDWFCADGERE